MMGPVQRPRAAGTCRQELQKQKHVVKSKETETCRQEQRNRNMGKCQQSVKRNLGEIRHVLTYPLHWGFWPAID